MLTLPNLFIIGAMKSGTSSLCNYLGTHPQIYISQPKEPMHFSREENWSDGNAQYLSLFSEATDEVYLGEGSTEYSKLPFCKGVVGRLYDFNPEAKLIYIMRDPYERIVSQYKHMVNKEGEIRKLHEVIATPADYLTNSYYAYQLRPYIEKFGRDALFIDTFENLVSRPEEICKKIFQWLDVDDTFIPPNLKTMYHVSPTKLQVVDESTLIRKITAWSEKQKYLNMAQFFPSCFKKWVKSKVLRKVEFDFSASDFQNDVAITRTAVGPLLRDWVEELEGMTGISYDDWSVTKKQAELTGSSRNLAERINKNVEQVLMGNG